MLFDFSLFFNPVQSLFEKYLNLFDLNPNSWIKFRKQFLNPKTFCFYFGPIFFSFPSPKQPAAQAIFFLSPPPPGRRWPATILAREAFRFTRPSCHRHCHLQRTAVPLPWTVPRLRATFLSAPAFQPLSSCLLASSIASSSTHRLLSHIKLHPSPPIPPLTNQGKGTIALNGCRRMESLRTAHLHILPGAIKAARMLAIFH
jgi:hypothetical protein